MAKAWHNKHISTKWGVGILFILLVGLIIGVSQLDKTQNLFGRAYNQTGVDNCPKICSQRVIECKQNRELDECKNFSQGKCVEECNLSKNLIGRIYTNPTFKKDVDYKLTSTGTLRVFDEKDSGLLKSMGRDRLSGDYIYVWKQRGKDANREEPKFYKQNSDVSIRATRMIHSQSTSRGTCRDKDIKGLTVLGCKYPDEESKCNQGFISGYCGGGDNYKCCVKTIDVAPQACDDAGGTCLNKKKYEQIFKNGRWIPGLCTGLPKEIQCFVGNQISSKKI